MDWVTVKWCFYFRQGKKTLLPFRASTPAMELAQPPVQWVPGVLSLAGTVKVTTQLHLMRRSRTSGATSPPSHLPRWRAKKQIHFILSKLQWYQHTFVFFYVLLTVHLSIFILVSNQIDAKNLFYNTFISCLYMLRAPCAHRQEVKIVLYSIWYHHIYRWPSRMSTWCSKHVEG